MRIYAILNYPGMQLDTASGEGEVSDQKFREFTMTIVIALATISFQAIKAPVANPVKSLRNE